MKNFHFTVTKYDGNEMVVYQAHNTGYYGDRDLEYNTFKRLSENHTWTRITKTGSSDMNSLFQSMYASAGTYHITGSSPIFRGQDHSFYGEPVSLGLQPGALNITEVDQHRRSVTVSRDALAYSQAMQRQSMERAQAIMQYNRDEVERRSAQRQAEQERLEAERNRPSRPWDRVRTFFGRD